MKRLLTYILSCGLLAAVGIHKAAGADYTHISPHPRILLPAGGEEAVQRTIEAYPYIAGVHDIIMRQCETMLKEPVSERVMEGKRLLHVSRAALTRIFYLSYGYRMTGNEAYVARAAAEMTAVCKFTDWNPSHFLDVGEMVMALAIGYDWLYDVLDDGVKSRVREAIVEKGFRAAENTRQAWFYRSTTNWNQVCNAGLVYGALAIRDEEPAMADLIIDRSLESIPLAMASYAPDGGYPEGYMYWGYGTGFQIMMIAALESALGSDYGLSAYPGFLRSATFMQYMTAPSGQCFNFGDSRADAYCNPMLFWCAAKTGDMSLLWLEREYLSRPDPLLSEPRLLPALMVFASQVDLSAIEAPSGNFWYSGGENPVLIYRGGWEDPNDTYLGVKGGTPATSHAHMDAGSFVYEKNGVRWAAELGMQEYFMLESAGVDLWNSRQDGQRWDVFRIGNNSHNTLTINGQRHRADGFADIVRTYMGDDRKGAEIDLSPIFSNEVSAVTRRVWLDVADDLYVDDNIVAGDDAAVVRWSMLTPAEPTVEADHIMLANSGKTMYLTVNCNGNVAATLTTWSTIGPNPYDAPNPGTYLVGFEATVPAGETASFTVKLSSDR